VKKLSHPRPAARAPRNETELALLRLAAIAIDVRGMLAPHEISNLPPLDRALLALDEFFRDRYQEGHRSPSQNGGSR
jgi:hypothetical protein